MGCWITLKKGEVRRGFSAATAKDALAVVEEMVRKGYEEVRIIDPKGIETNATYLPICCRQR